MCPVRGLLGLAVLLGVGVLFSVHRRRIPWRTVGAALALQVVFALLVLRWGPGRAALDAVAGAVESLIGYADEGTAFLFGPLTEVGPSLGSVFAFGVLPVIIFLGAIIQLLFYLRVVQHVAWALGGAIGWLLRVSRLESFFASVVIFLGQSEAPLMIAPYLKRLTRSQLFAVMTGGFAAAAGSTLLGYAQLGAPLPYLLAATAMNAPASLLMAKLILPETEPVQETTGDDDVRRVRDTESANAIDALGRGAMAGGRIAVVVGALLIAFIALLALVNGVVGGIASWFGADGVTVQGVLGWLLAPLAWLLGVPWSEAGLAGSWIGQKTFLNEFVAYSDFGPQVASLDPLTVAVVTIALAGFANLGSIAIMIGVIGSLSPERRGEVAALAPRALLAGAMANLANAAVAAVVLSL
ncbi:NupC/NupG family nucleoside CNT transporter [Quadrisphaera sp. INWT6]|nr:NupC/NupG family nucleoside CNT transporter [Quadrisphaera sp. INWT6]